MSLQYIKDWHDYVEREPDKHCEDIKKLKTLIENLLKNDAVFYDPVDVKAFEDFCLLLRHREGRWAGQPFVLSIEEKYIAACVLGFKTWDAELEMNVRYFRGLVILVARKWGKSMFISALLLYFLMADNEAAAQIWCLATQKQQAGIVYDNAKAFVLSSEVLRKYVRTKRDKSNDEILIFPETQSYMKAGGKNSENQDGLNPHVFAIDELHAIKNRNTYDVFSSAQGARTQPMEIIISTFGFVREGIFDGIFGRCQKVLNGETTERLFPMIFRIDDTDNPNNRDCWIKANPGIGSHPTRSYIEGEYQKAINDPAQWPTFLAKHLNRATSLSVVYFKLEDVNRCAIDMDIENMLRGRYAVGGDDLSETTDLCCASALVPLGGKLYLWQKYFIARARLERNSKADHMAYETFCQTGAKDPLNNELLQICEGGIVTRKDVAHWHEELSLKYGVIFWKIGADRWHYSDYAEEMKMRGYPEEDKDGNGILFQVAWGPRTLSEPMKETRTLFEDQVVQFSKYNGLFRWCVTNTAAEIIGRNNEIAPDKVRSKARIDGYASFLNAYIAYKKCIDLFKEYQP